MEPTLELVEQRIKGRGGVGVAIIVSALIHAAILGLFLLRHPPQEKKNTQQMARLVELIRSAPQQHTEAPGPKVETAPLSAPLSNANRKASAPDRTGPKPTKMPGPKGVYVPGGNPLPPQSPQGAVQPQPASRPDREAPETARLDPDRIPPLQDPSRQPQTAKSTSNSIDWNSAIREVGKVASLGGETIGASGGEEGFAESGPISFETQWYAWGDYADAMVRKIRHNWYNNMPSLIRMGIKGVVVIRFTIHRDGEITDVTILRTSEIPPFDFAAKKAIEISSRLRPLPSDFPNSTERVTAAFYYNINPKEEN